MLIDGKKIAGKILETVAAEVSALSFRPVLCDVVVGDDPVSLSYVTVKGKAAEVVGMEFKLVRLPADVSQTELVARIQELNSLPNLCGLLVQLPLPSQLDRQIVLSAIDPQVDVDCLTAQNQERFYAGEPRFVPPAPAAIVALLDSISEEFSSKKFLIVGQGELVGRPVAALLLSRHYTVTVADQSTNNVAELAIQADVIISGTGKSSLINGSMVKPTAIVIDAGTAEMDGGIYGDVERATVESKVAWLAPVPGGVGPVTVAMLLSNVLRVAKSKRVA